MNITMINKDNIDAFEPFLSPEIKEGILSEEVISVGAYDDEAENVATGVLAGEVGAPDADEAFRIRYLFTDPDRRREGVATLLLDYMSNMCLKQGLEVFVAEYPDDEEYADVAAFFDEAGFDKEDSGVKEYLLYIGKVKELKMFADTADLKPSPMIKNFAELKRTELKALAGDLYREGNTCFYELLESGILDEELSIAYRKDDKLCAVMAASVDDDGITVEWVYSDPKEYKLLLPTIKAFAAGLAKKFDDDTAMHITGMTQDAQDLLAGLFKDSISKTTSWVKRSLAF